MENYIKIPTYLKNLFLITIIAIFLPDFSLGSSSRDSYSSHDGAGGINNVRFFLPIITTLFSFFIPSTQARYLEIIKEKRFKYIILPMICFFISFVYGVYTTPDLMQKDIGINFFTTCYRCLSLLITLLPLVFLENLNDLKKFIGNLLLVLSILFCFMAIVEYIAHFTYDQIVVAIYDFFHSRKYYSISESAVLTGEQLSFLPRLSFYAAEPAFASCLLYVLWPIALYSFLEDKNQINKNKLWIAASFMVYTILTLSTTVFLIFPLQVFVFLFLSKRFKIKEIKKIRNILIVLFIIIFLALAAQTDFLINNLKKIVFLFTRGESEEMGNMDMSALIRSAGFVLSFKMFEASPILGIGAGNFLNYTKILIEGVLEYIGNPRAVQAIMMGVYDLNMGIGSPNWFLRILVETGLLGILMHLMFFFNIYRHILKKIQDKIFLVLFIVGNLVVVSSQGGDEIFYFLVGLGNAYAYFENNKKTSKEV